MTQKTNQTSSSKITKNKSYSLLLLLLFCLGETGKIYYETNNKLQVCKTHQIIYKQ